MSPPPDLSDLSDQEVVAWACLGREEGYTELVRRHEPRVRGLIYRIVGDSDLAQDLAQVSFYQAFRALHSYRPEFPFWPWMRRIAHNTAVDHLRAKQQREALERRAWLFATTPQKLAGTAVPVTDPRRSTRVRVNKEEFWRALEEAIPRLTEYDRKCFTLHVLKGRPYGDIAKRLGMTPAAVRAHLSRARKQLRAILGLRSDYLLQDTPTPSPA